MIQNISIKNKITSILLVITIITSLKSCGIYRKVDAKDFPPEPEKRVQKNLEEGRGFKLFGNDKNNGGGNFDFASSNEMWRASLDILNFMPLISADYGGGLIITDWYNDQGQTNESIKITIRFLTNEIRADALEITVFNKNCKIDTNCRIVQSNTKIEEELKVAILTKAAKYKKDFEEAKPKNRKRPLSTITNESE
jgi:hypothetical protein